MPAKTRHPDVILEPVMCSAAMRRVDRTLKLVAPKDVTVTLIGESGTGKEVLARRIHELSERRRGPFIPINCAAIPETLFESELFGHERGAFTGANVRTKGKIEAASAGTLFLDEVGELPLAMQTKLLRFLESRRYMRVGGTTKIDANVRLVFATLRALEDDVRGGRFRADLYYRIQGITLEIPALRERQADILPLAAQFIEQLSSRHSLPPPKLTRGAKATLVRYAWPGNVRELRNVIEMLCLLRSGATVRSRDLPLALQTAASDDDARHPQELRLSLEQSLEAMVSEIIQATLAAESGNQTRAAERLQISVRTIQRHAGRHRPHAANSSGRRTRPRGASRP